ncbi:hypothetical protein BCV69DRAFT_199815 [Microstroma glucosiphilum]|uniref:PHD-type domain-containing protein n=1 Tax=Pseudomicrostroma glucosiphilum TaxID=1684307 RepID=A0A316U6H1_9BASI|nr:hypothetical protein BCV69DRAFT_199815 [Pseudomicrostroma glucosiphilum]PWN20810.1 hypothetical protein BCV69DRAFT_199815 [Pseudomicrostroma glucosiphilum]
MADVLAEPAQSTKSAAGVVNGGTSMSAPNTENDQAVGDMQVIADSPSIGADMTSSSATEGIDALQAPRLPTHAQDHGAALAPTARSDGQKSDRDLAQASRLDQLPNTSTVAPSALDGEMESNKPQDQDIAMAEEGDSTQEGSSSGLVPTGKRATATKKRRSTQTTKAPVTITDGNTTPSRASSVSRGEVSESGSVTTPHRTASTLIPEDISGPSRDVLALSASPTLASLSAARPTRAAVAKVAARGSYYDASTYEVQSPLQAAVVKNIQTTPRSTSANRRVNGSASRAVATSASSLTGTPTPTSKAANDKGKEKEVDNAVDGKEGLNEEALNEDFCSTCRGTGHFICCDSCPRSFHFACVNPPLDINEVPLDDNSEWHCRACSAQRRSSSQGTQKKGSAKQQRSAARGGRFFAPLVDQTESSNPSIFALPPDIKSFFKNVATAADGSYQDLGRQRAIKADRKGLIEERDPYRLKDAKGKDILCYHCGQSALPKDWNPRRGDDATPNSSWRCLVSCDYCSLHWHLDCLNPPRASIPSSLYKWRCPCHIEDLLVKTRTAKAGTQLQVVDLPVPTLLNTGFGPGKIYRPRVLNSGVIDIVPDPMDTYFTAASSSDTSGRSLQPGWMNGGRADMPPLVDGEIPGGGMRRVKFRLPEKVVRTDWWMKVLQGGRDALISGEKRGASAMELLASIATDELEHQGEARDLVQLALTGSQPPSMRVQPLVSHSKPQEPLRKGFVPHPGGKLKREEDEQWAESAMRGSLHLVDDEEEGAVTGKAKTNGSVRAAAVSASAAVPSASSESDLTDLSDEEGKGKAKAKVASSEAIDDAATPRSGKRAKVAHPSDKASSTPLTQEELDSLLAVRELMRKKGEGKLMNFLMAE